ncbi:hypothetical protein AMECASPLE_033237 [Ameca splendens]|uniref:Uncharacterized protein n=1 Tax=Ameca splendens TaxID=208324 RepID=A0ABV0Z5N4_9TELE
MLQVFNPICNVMSVRCESLKPKSNSHCLCVQSWPTKLILVDAEPITDLRVADSEPIWPWWSREVKHISSVMIYDVELNDLMPPQYFDPEPRHCRIRTHVAHVVCSIL